jgi:hypothetical protein
MHGFSDRESRRSQLSFVSSHESSEPPDCRYLKRAREPVGRSKSGVQGKIADVFRSRSRHAESQNELKGFQVLLATGRADDWQEQPFLLEYHCDGVKRRYTPDVLVVWGTHREVVEIKDDTEADLPDSQKRFALIRELLAEHGYHFRVWRRSEISAEPRLANAGLLLRYRRVVVSPMEQEKIRRVFAFAPEVCLRTFCKTQGIAVQSVLRMVLDGTLHINWWKPITLDSQISSAPIGPRVWPFPPYDAQPQDCTRRDDVAIRI